MWKQLLLSGLLASLPFPAFASEVSELYRTAQIRFAEWRLPEAIATYEKAIELNENPAIEAELRLARFIALKTHGNNLVMGLPRKAIKVLEKAIEMAPDDPFLWHRMGDAYCEIPEPDKCIRSHQQGLEVSTDKGDSLDRLARVYLKIKDSEMAAQTYQLAAIEHQKSGRNDRAQMSKRIAQNLTTMDPGHHNQEVSVVGDLAIIETCE